jgi:hypothetical protein
VQLDEMAQQEHFNECCGFGRCEVGSIRFCAYHFAVRTQKSHDNERKGNQ